MKKKIAALLNAETAKLNINELFVLRRYQHDALNNECDALNLEFIGSPSAFVGKIESRDVQGIVAEVEEFMQRYMTARTEEMLRQLKGGLIGDVRIIEEA